MMPSSSSSSSSSSAAVVELTDPATGCRVLLIGCFHGSNSSATDVKSMIDTDTDVVVLELCASRFADLRRDMMMMMILEQERAQTTATAQTAQTQTQTAQATSATLASTSEQERMNIDKVVPISIATTSTPKSKSKPKRPWILRYASTVAATARERGFGAGLAFAILGGVSAVQTSLSGLVPGLEFTVALQAAKQVNADIVLADQVVEDTLHNIGNLPTTSILMWRELLQTGGNWHDTFGKEAAALQTAIVGNATCQPHQLTLPAFLTRSRASLEEGVRSTVPPFLLLQCLIQSANMAAEQLVVVHPATATAVVALPAVTVTTVTDLATPESLAMNVFNLAILAIGYISVALPAARVVLRERDDQLTAGIQQACRLAVQGKGKRGNNNNNNNNNDDSNNNNSAPPGKVVAVLGLLHVNGVAQRILSSSAMPPPLPPPPSQGGTMDRDSLLKNNTDTAPRIASREILGDRALVPGDDGASS
jgi:hypothetical protein